MFSQLAIRSMIVVSFLLSTNFPTETSNQEVDNNVEQTTEEQLLTETNEAKAVTPSTTNVAANNETSEEEIEAPEEVEEEKEELTEEEKLSQKVENWEKEIPRLEGNSKQAKFVNAIAPAAVAIAHEQGIYPSVIIAQASLESAWGTSGLAKNYNNLMGTKGSWNGNSVTTRTREVYNGQSVYIDAGFSVYDSWKDSLNRYGHLLRDGIKGNSEFYKGTWRENASTYQEATAWLQGRYATDTSYASKLNQTISSFNLDQFDEIQPLEEDFDEIYEYISTEIK